MSSIKKIEYNHLKEDIDNSNLNDYNKVRGDKMNKIVENKKPYLEEELNLDETVYANPKVNKVEPKHKKVSNQELEDDFDKRWDAKFGVGDKRSSVTDFFKEFEEMRSFK